MLIFSFIMSLIMAIVLVSFTIMLVVVLINQKKLKNKANQELDNLINGFKTYDLNDSIGGINEEKK